MPTGQTELESRRVDFSYNGNEGLLRDLKKFGKRELEDILARVLRHAGLSGSFALNISTIVRGSSFQKGLKISKPIENRRMVEFTWQGGSGNKRFNLAITVPHGLETIPFQELLDKTLRKLEDDEEEERAKQKKANGVAFHIDAPADSAETARDSDLVDAILASDEEPETVEAPESVTEEVDDRTRGQREVERFMKLICKSAPDLGLIDREECFDILSELGDDNAELALTTLVGAKYLIPLAGSDQMFRVSDEYRKKYDSTFSPDVSESAESEIVEQQVPPEEKTVEKPSPTKLPDKVLVGALQSMALRAKPGATVTVRVPRPDKVRNNEPEPPGKKELESTATPRFDVLAELAKVKEKMRQSDKYRTERDTIDSDLKEVSRKMADLESQRTRLLRRRKELEEVLSSPEYRQAEDTLAAIEKLLKT